MERKNKLILLNLKYNLVLAIALLVWGCEKEASVYAPSFQVAVSSTMASVGDPVTFQISGDADIISFYSGELGSHYDYLAGRVVSVDEVKLSFESRVNLGVQPDQLSVWVSSDFSGSYNVSSLRAANWTDITDRFTLGTIANVYAPSGNADITDVLQRPAPLYVAFKYTTHNQDEYGKHRTWTIQNFDLQSTTLLGEESVGTQRNGGWQIVADGEILEDGRSSVSSTSGNITLRGNLNNGADIYTEHWGISRAFDINDIDVGPDTGTIIKTAVDQPLTSFTHRYESPGTYKVVFLASNQRSEGHRYVVKELEITVID